MDVHWKEYYTLTCLIKSFPQLITPVPNKINEETFSSNSPPPTSHQKQLENQPHLHGKLSLASQEADDHRYRRGTRTERGRESYQSKKRGSDFRGGLLGVSKYWETRRAAFERVRLSSRSRSPRRVHRLFLLSRFASRVYGEERRSVTCVVRRKGKKKKMKKKGKKKRKRERRNEGKGRKR